MTSFVQSAEVVECDIINIRNVAVCCWYVYSRHIVRSELISCQAGQQYAGYRYSGCVVHAPLLHHNGRPLSAQEILKAEQNIRRAVLFAIISIVYVNIFDIPYLFTHL